jgi:hypothetical protein
MNKRQRKKQFKQQCTKNMLRTLSMFSSFRQSDVRIKITLRRIKRNTDVALQEREDNEEEVGEETDQAEDHQALP